jgi:hypothetical protein
MAKEIDYVELLKLAHEKLGSQSDMIELLKGKIFKQSQESKEAVSRAIEIILEKDDKIAELDKELEEAMSFNVDVIRCLSRIASVENHNEVPAYIDMSRRCIKTIEAKQAKALKSEPNVSSEGEFWVELEETLNQEEALKEQE